MPFVKKTGAKVTQQPIEARKIFIGRTEELHFFREHILKPDDPSYNIVSISGQGGVGKSTLLLRFIEEVRATDFKNYCLTALVNERQATAADVIEKFADRLHLEGDFEQALRQYKEVLRKLQSQREAAREALARQFTTDVAGSVVKDVPFVGGLLKEGVSAATNYLFDELRYRQLFKDAERLEDPLGDLTRVFVGELNRLTETLVAINSSRVKRQRRVLLFFDTFEQLAARCASWLLDYFLESDVSSNVVLVIAGRDSLELSTPDGPKRWLPYHDDNTIYSISLNSFTKEETRSYLAERDIIEEGGIETLWQLSHGLPLYLGLLTSNPQGQVDPTANVVANFLRWIPEQGHRLALDASLFSRPFNQDELSVFTYISEQERPTLFQWLVTQTFVRSNLQDGRYSYHELAQELFNRHLYQLSPSQCHATREALAKYYQGLLMDIEASQGEDVYGSSQWLELILALIYQLFLLPDEASHIQAIEQILSAYERPEQQEEIVKILRNLLKEHLGLQINTRTRQTIKRLLQYIELNIERQEYLQAANYLLEKLTPQTSVSVKLLAAIYCNRSRAYRNRKDYERALADCNKAIELNPTVVAAYIQRCTVYYELEDYERALADCKKAIELDPTSPLCYTWRGAVYYKFKDYERAQADFNKAIVLDPNDPLWYKWRGAIYYEREDYERAQADFSKASELDYKNAATYIQRSTDLDGYARCALIEGRKSPPLPTGCATRIIAEQ